MKTKTIKTGIAAILAASVLAGCNGTKYDEITELKAGAGYFHPRYCGMPNKETFSLGVNYLNFYYPANSTNINLSGMNLQILEVTPEKIRYKRVK